MGATSTARFLEKFSKVKFGIKIQLFLVSINVVSVSFTQKAPRDGQGRASRRPSATAPALHHPPKPSFMDRWRPGELRCVRPLSRPQHFHASMQAHASRGCAPIFTAPNAWQTDEGQLTLPLICFPRVHDPAARHADRGLTQTRSAWRSAPPNPLTLRGLRPSIIDRIRP